MASSTREYEQMTKEDSSLDDKDELERVKECLREVMRKNQALEEMLLYTTQELEKEKENSRKIVQTLTERLMESREMINKLEVENMRYKKDCLLAVELLQCNRNVDQGVVSSTIKKLSDYTDPVRLPTYTTAGHNANEKSHPNNVNKSTKDEIKNFQPFRPRTSSKHKIKSEVGSNEDTTALLGNKETNDSEADMLGQVKDSLTPDNKVLKEKESLLEYHKDLRGNKTPERIGQVDVCNIPNHSLLGNEQHEKVKGKSVEGLNNEDSCLKEAESLNEELSKDKPPIANERSENMGSQPEKSVEPDGSSDEVTCRKNEPEFLTDEWLQEDKPLIVNQTESLAQQSLITPETKENENAASMCPSKGKNRMQEENATQSNSLTTTIREGASIIQTKAMQEETVDKEADKLLSLEAERSEETATQQISSEISMPAVSKIASIVEDNSLQTKDDEWKAEVEGMGAIDGGDDESMNNSLSKEREDKSNDGNITTKVTEADDETLTAEENTPLV